MENTNAMCQKTKHYSQLCMQYSDKYIHVNNVSHVTATASLYIKRGKVSVGTFVRNAGRGQLSNELRHNENDVIMIIAGLCRCGD